MNYEQLENMFNNIIHENQLAHAYLIETNDVLKCCDLVKKIVKKIICTYEYSDSCSKCNLCHLVNNNNLPSYIEVWPEGKIIKKEAIESLKKQFANKPIYTSNNIYTIVKPECMNATAFNKMLKFLEEPEDGILGFFITENKDYVAKTIVSRCQLLKANFETKSSYLSDDNYQLALDINNLLSDNCNNLIWHLLSELKLTTYERSDIISIFQKILDINLKDVDNEISFKKVKILKKYLEQLNFNVNIELLLNSFAVEMGDLYESL